MIKLDREFYRRSSIEVAKELLGRFMVHRVNGRELIVKIVETEAYMGPEDKAAHSYNNRRTKRTEVMFGPPGHAYVFLIYGMYSCMNVVASEIGKPQAVLIRAAEPVEGLEHMAQLRFKKGLNECTKKRNTQPYQRPRQALPGHAHHRTKQWRRFMRQPVVFPAE